MASFSELIAKMAEASEALSPMEKQQLRDETRAIEESKNLVKKWVVSGTSTPVFQPSMQVIYSEAISSNTAQIDIRIPAGFKHLLIMGTGRCDLVGLADSLFLRFNSDTGSNYGRTGFGTDAGAYNDYHVTSDTKCLIGLLPGTTATANANGMIFAYVLHVGLSSFWKSIIATRGIFSGGGTSPVTNVIQYVTIASTGNSTDFGDLTVARQYTTGTSSSTTGITTGGYGSSGGSNVIDSVTIATTGNAVSFGSLTGNQYFMGACSNCHGGI